MSHQFRPLKLVFTSGDPNTLSASPRERRFTILPLRQFRVSIVRPDGSSTDYVRHGGSSCDHVAEAIDAAGLGGVVRVLPVSEAAE